METVSALTDQSVEETLAGKKHKFRRITLAELFGKYEAVVQNEWRLRIRTMADELDSGERLPFMVSAMSNPPAANQITTLVKDKANSQDGIAMILSLTHLKEDKNDLLPDITALVTDEIDKVVVKGLIKELTGTAGIPMEGGADVDPKAP
jgi:hypothetical protein